MAQTPSPSRIVGKRVQAARADQEISAARLAARCSELGDPGLTRDVITAIETGRREDVGVDEVFVLATALNVSPLVLLLPLGSDQRMAVTPKIKVHPYPVLEWLVGAAPLLNTNRTARIRPWPDEKTPDWAKAAQPLYLYRKLRELQDVVRSTLPGVGQTWRDDDQRDQALAALDRLRGHVEGMQYAGLDEHRIIEEYEKIITKIEET